MGEKDKAKESSYISMDVSTKVTGFRTKDMVVAMNVMSMEIYTRVSIKTVKLMERGSLLGLMVRYTMENGVKESNKDTEYGKE